MDRALVIGVGIQGAVAGGLMIRGALAIAGERERRTLDFLLVSDLSSAEIVLGKLAGFMAISLGLLAAGFPILLLLHALGGLDLRLILLIDPIFAMSPLFAGTLAILISVEMPGRRSAAAISALATIAWLIGPLAMSTFLPKMGIHPPRWLMTANWWITLSSPLWLGTRFATGLHDWDQLVFESLRMVVIQLGATSMLLAIAIVRLRPAHRALASRDRGKRRRLVWRLRPRPDVGDDPILWREKYTSRLPGFLKAVMVPAWVLPTLALAVATFQFARPAFVEVWQHGYATPATPAEPPEMNVLITMFATGPGPGADAARLAFNLVLRWTTVPIVLIAWFVCGGIAGEVIGVERMKQTWSSLLATTLEPRQIVRAAILSALWRVRYAFALVLVLWGLGMATGALHPMGVLVALLLTASSTWMLCVHCVWMAVQSKKDAEASNAGLVAAMLLLATGALPLSLPDGFNTLFWGVGCMPMMVWTALISPREAAVAIASPFEAGRDAVYTAGGPMPVLVVVAWMIAIVGPALAGWWTWRVAIVGFDQIVGRPHRITEAPERDVSLAVPAKISPLPTTDSNQ